MTSIGNYVFNRGLYREIFVGITILFAISFFTPFSTILNLFLLSWGGILILKDLFTERIIFKSKRFIPLIIFMFFYFITVVINRNLNLFENVKIFALTALQFFVIFTFDVHDNYDNIKNEMKKFNRIIINMTFVATCISLLVYLFGIGFTINGHVVGLENGMLNGIYTGANTAGPLSSISIILTIINYQFSKRKKLSKFEYANIIVQLIFIYTTNSRASLYSMIVFGIIFALFYFEGAKKKTISVVGVVAVYYLSKIVNEAVYWLYRGINFIEKVVVYGFRIAKSYITKDGITPSIDDSIISNISPGVSGAVEKEINRGFLNGRAQLWECGVKMIKENPWFGVGSRNVYHVALKYGDMNSLPGIEGGGMHNIIMQVLVSNGILGFLALLVFIVPIIFVYLKYLIDSKLKSHSSKTVLLVSALLLMLLVHNMVEASILYSASYMATVFWTYLGYGLFIMDKDSRGEISD